MILTTSYINYIVLTFATAVSAAAVSTPAGSSIPDILNNIVVIKCVVKR